MFKNSVFRTSIIIPVMNETDSLRQTVEIVLGENASDIFEIIIVVAKRTTEESRAIAEELATKHAGIVKILNQTLPFLGGAMRDAFDIAAGDHILMMASDFETDPHTVKDMIRAAHQHPEIDIITTSRWLSGGGFKGYGFTKLLLNFCFQKLFSILYGVAQTDLTFGFRLYKAVWLHKFIWTENKHPFLFECLLKPLRAGAHVLEIPSPWRARTQGESQNSMSVMFSYTKTGLRIRFTPLSYFLKSEQN